MYWYDLNGAKQRVFYGYDQDTLYVYMNVSKNKSVNSNITSQVEKIKHIF